MREFPFDGWLRLNSWAGYNECQCLIVGETPNRFRIQATQTMRLPGRSRWLHKGETALVPKSAIRAYDTPAHKDEGSQAHFDRYIAGDR